MCCCVFCDTASWASPTLPSSQEIVFRNLHAAIYETDASVSTVVLDVVFLKHDSPFAVFENVSQAGSGKRSMRDAK